MPPKKNKQTKRFTPRASNQVHGKPASKMNCDNDEVVKFNGEGDCRENLCVTIPGLSKPDIDPQRLVAMESDTNITIENERGIAAGHRGRRKSVSWSPELPDDQVSNVVAKKLRKQTNDKFPDDKDQDALVDQTVSSTRRGNRNAAGADRQMPLSERPQRGGRGQGDSGEVPLVAVEPIAQQQQDARELRVRGNKPSLLPNPSHPPNRLDTFDPKGYQARISQRGSKSTRGGRGGRSRTAPQPQPVFEVPAPRESAECFVEGGENRRNTENRKSVHNNWPNESQSTVTGSALTQSINGANWENRKVASKTDIGLPVKQALLPAVNKGCQLAADDSCSASSATSSYLAGTLAQALDDSMEVSEQNDVGLGGKSSRPRKQVNSEWVEAPSGFETSASNDAAEVQCGSIVDDSNDVDMEAVMGFGQFGAQGQRFAKKTLSEDVGGLDEMAHSRKGVFGGCPDDKKAVTAKVKKQDKVVQPKKSQNVAWPEEEIDRIEREAEELDRNASRVVEKTEKQIANRADRNKTDRRPARHLSELDTRELYIDAHAHLDYMRRFRRPDFRNPNFNDLQEMLNLFTRGSKSERLQGFIWNVVKPEYALYDGKWIEQMIKEQPLVLGVCIGCHPSYADEYSEYAKKRVVPKHSKIGSMRDFIVDFLEHRKERKIVAIGECGIDTVKSQVSFTLQMIVLISQLELAKDHNLPVVIHLRTDAQGERAVLDAIVKHLGSFHTVHWHCASTKVDTIREWMTTLPNCYFGYTPRVDTVLRGVRGDEYKALRMIPITKLLLETDAPFFPTEFVEMNSEEEGVPRMSNPYQASVVAEAIAIAKGMDRADVLRETRLNALRLYGLDKNPEMLHPRKH